METRGGILGRPRRSRRHALLVLAMLFTAAAAVSELYAIH